MAGSSTGDTEIELLMERVREGIHTLMTTAPYGQDKPVLRRLKCFETIFIDLESVSNPKDDIAGIGFRSTTAAAFPCSPTRISE